jgi:hypothetical protein
MQFVNSIDNLQTPHKTMKLQSESGCLDGVTQQILAQNRRPASTDSSKQHHYNQYNQSFFDNLEKLV